MTTQLATPAQKLPAKSAGTLGEFLSAQKNQLQMALPKHISVDRLLRIALTAVRKRPKLALCTKESFYSALLECAQLGIEPDSSLGGGWLLPYGTDCQFMLGYRGMIDLARRSGDIKDIWTRVVYENDFFKRICGVKEEIIHEPTLGESGKMIGVYCITALTNGEHHIEFMKKDEIDKIRSRSKSKNDGPWVTDYDEQARKTVVRRSFKYLPVSTELRDAIEREDEREFIQGEYSVNGEESKAKNLTARLENKSVVVTEKRVDAQPEKPKATTTDSAEEFFGADDEYLNKETGEVTK